MSEKVAIIGIGMSQFGELWDRSFTGLIVEAGSKAIKNAGITPKDIDALFGGNMSAGLFVDQEHIASLVMDNMGLLNKPATRVESACASGGVALRTAYTAIRSGMHDIVVVGGVEKMTDIMSSQATSVLGAASDQEWEVFYGATFPALYALVAKRHMHHFGTTEEQMAQVAVKNHHNGSLNDHAHFQFEIDIDKVLKSPMVSTPLKLLDCSPISDGAAAVILASEKKAKELCDNPVWIKGTGQATDTISLHDRNTLCTFNATVEASRQAYKQAGLTAKDIDFAEVHDCFTIAELVAIEDLGFCKKGEGGKFTEAGETSLKGSIPINPSGGLKAKGHPVGATGIAQVCEATLHLRGAAKERQVKDAKTALIHNVGGSGGSCTVHILGGNE